MGEPKSRVHVVGSPRSTGSAASRRWMTSRRTGDPALLLMHPIGRPDEQEEAVAKPALEAIGERATLCLMPNLDPAGSGSCAIESASAQRT